MISKSLEALHSGFARKEPLLACNTADVYYACLKAFQQPNCAGLSLLLSKLTELCT